MTSPANEFDDWAPYYDLIHDGQDGDAEFYVGNALKMAGDTLVAGCGSGRIALPMAMGGLDVVGLDISLPMLDICRARQAALGSIRGRLALVQADARAFALRRKFDFIVLPYRVFMHLLTPADRSCALTCLHQHLKDGGTLMLDLWSPNRSERAVLREENGKGRQFVAEYKLADKTRLRQFCATTVDEEAGHFVEKHVLKEVDEKGRIMHTSNVTLTRAWLSATRMKALLATHGFNINAILSDFDARPWKPGQSTMIYVLGKA